MEAILRFKLPKENAEFKQASRASEYHGMLFEISEEVRKYRKYGKLPEDSLTDIADIIGELDEL
jgi:hypothetical protein